ncbi:MAG: hypothetical protein Q9195_008646 [Heterodermia aff. obscurata]
MDILLGKVTQQAMNYAIRSGITITAGYAIRQSSRLLKTVEGNERDELQDLQERLNSKIKIISPAIDMIELISARGNTSLESAVSLTKSLRWEIQSLGQRLAAAANAEELAQRGSSKAQDKDQNHAELKRIVVAIRKLLSRIEDAVPLINLAITASGASLSSTLPSTVSPSRLLQASTFLTAGDAQYGVPPVRSVQIGPKFTLSMYMLFLGHVRPQDEADIRDSTWKEVIHKANVKLMRVPIDAIYSLPGLQQSNVNGNTNDSTQTADGATDGYFPTHFQGDAKADEYAYQLVIIEDLDDDRVHTFDDDEEQPGPCEEVDLAGIREAIPIHELSKIFYADTGKILNIGNDGETNSPVLLLKRDINAVPPRRMMEHYSDEDTQGNYGNSVSRPGTSSVNGDHESASQLSLSQHEERELNLDSTTSQTKALVPMSKAWRLPLDLDPEWIAFEVYTESPDSDTESEIETSTTNPPKKPSRTPSLDTQATKALSRLQLTSPLSPSPHPPASPSQTSIQPRLPAIQTSLSLLETLLRLLSLQQFQQLPHLSIPDELLTFFLSESASTGSDGEDRKRLRNEARRRVGFDPYDESPVKRRGEEYQYQRQSHDNAWSEGEAYDSYEYGSPSLPAEGYGSPIRFDEGYETHPWSRSPGPRATPSPRTPPMLLKGQSPRSAGSKGSSPLRWAGQKVLAGERDTGRRGSPLARPGTGIRDEGLGTSPASGGEGESERKEK